MEAGQEVDRCEPLGTREVVEVVLYVRQREVLTDRQVVQVLVINGETPCAIGLLDEQRARREVRA